MTESITAEVAGQKITGTVTDSDAFFFAALYYNEEELALADKGQEIQAFEKLSDRLKKQADLKIQSSDLDYAKATAEVELELGSILRRKIENDWNIRKNVTWRIKEIFPTISPESVYWNSEASFGIRLDVKDLLVLFTAIFMTFFKNQENLEEVVLEKEEAAVDRRKVNYKKVDKSSAAIAIGKTKEAVPIVPVNNENKAVETVETVEVVRVEESSNIEDSEDSTEELTKSAKIKLLEDEIAELKAASVSTLK